MILILVMRFWNISLSRFTVNIAFIVTSSDVFIEICSVAAIEGVLLSVMVAKMINLKTSIKVLNAKTKQEFQHLPDNWPPGQRSDGQVVYCDNQSWCRVRIQ